MTLHSLKVDTCSGSLDEPTMIGVEYNVISSKSVKCTRIRIDSVTMKKTSLWQTKRRLVFLTAFFASFCVSFRTIEAFQGNSVLGLSSSIKEEAGLTTKMLKLQKRDRIHKSHNRSGPNYHRDRAIQTSRSQLSVSFSYGDNSDRGKQYRKKNYRNEKKSIIIDSHPLLKELNKERRQIIQMTIEEKYKHVAHSVESMLKMVKKSTDENAFRSQQEKKQILRASSVIIDETVSIVTKRAFAFPIYTGSEVITRVFAGLDVVDLQLRKKTKGILVAPYTTVPRSTLVEAIRALNKLTPRSSMNIDDSTSKWAQRRAHIAFSLLRRLISGIGVRQPLRNGISISKQFMIAERDFCSVLRAFVEVDNMDMAHKIMALQERTVDAPDLSSVPYSILIKAYGRLGDASNVQRVWRRTTLAIEPDVIMCNSAIDAFVNCGKLNLAEDIFSAMMKPDLNSMERPSNKLPSPNTRTFNTMLKGYAKAASWEKASKLYKTIEEKGLNWDHITTNTLVSAAVSSGSFDTAESILANHTYTIDAQVDGVQKHYHSRKKHPNVEAYTELLDGYAKAGMLNKALNTLKLMRERDVQPNVYTYSSLIGALARSDKILQAKKMLEFMEYTDHISPNVITYNAFLTGMLTRPEIKKISHNSAAMMDLTVSMETREEEAFHLLSKMTNSGIRPNAVTVASLVEFLSIHCSPSRINVARDLVATLDKAYKGHKYMHDKRVATIFIKAYSISADLDSATIVFSDIHNPDVVALNAYLDACCQCDKIKLAMENFNQICALETRRIAPDVVTYSVIISSLLEYKDNPRAASKVRELYLEMKNVEGILPDTGLVDLILTAMITGGRIGVDKADIKFTLDILRDAESLEWPSGYLERRQKIVRGVILGRVSEVWKLKEDHYGMNSKLEDPLFKKKGWNTVDSGFRLWGGGNNEVSETYKPSRRSKTDEFLESKGWNDMDSGFRLL